MYRIVILPKALRSLESLDRPTAARIIERLSSLAENFDDLSHLPLKGGLSGTCKMRAGDWQIIYSFDVATRSSTVHLIGHRKEIYKLT